MSSEAKAAKKQFLQLPISVWSKVRDRIIQTPSVKITDGFLSSVLKVDKSAASQYVTQFRRMGIIDEKGDLTSRGREWRDDVKYSKVTSEIIEENYPTELRSVAPPPTPNKEDVIHWFQHSAGLGAGAAANKASTYMMLASGDPKTVAVAGKTDRAKSTPGATRKTEKRVDSERVRRGPEKTFRQATMPSGIQLNIQIHISADASVQQIDAIFASMARHLGNHGS